MSDVSKKKKTLALSSTTNQIHNNSPLPMLSMRSSSYLKPNIDCLMPTGWLASSNNGNFISLRLSNHIRIQFSIDRRFEPRGRGGGGSYYTPDLT
jgi:hypothetical protein